MNFLYVAMGGAIGFIVGLAAGRKNLSPQVVLFLKTGFCGGFTTFSTFSLEAVNLFGKKQYLSGGLYVVCSLVFCLIGVWTGEKLAAICG